MGGLFDGARGGVVGRSVFAMVGGGLNTAMGDSWSRLVAVICSECSSTTSTLWLPDSIAVAVSRFVSADRGRK